MKSLSSQEPRICEYVKHGEFLRHRAGFDFLLMYDCGL